MLAKASGWAKNVIGSYNGVQVHDGDLIALGNEDPVKLLVNDPGSFPIFADLVPLEQWFGKRILVTRGIPGKFVFFSSGSYFNKENIYMIHFEDGQTSVFFVPGDCIVNHAEEHVAPDIDLMVKAGILTKPDGRRIIRERKKNDRRYYDLESIICTMPGLVDLFSDNGSPPKWNYIVGIHKIYDASDCEYRSGNVYMLRFADGKLSLPFGLCGDRCLELNIDGLLSAALISEKQLRQATLKLRPELKQKFVKS